jgi:hypothetical protein
MDREWARKSGVAPPGEIADSQMGVTPAPFMGVRSPSPSPKNREPASSPALRDFGSLKVVINLSAEFLAVTRDDRTLGGDIGGSMI